MFLLSKLLVLLFVFTLGACQSMGGDGRPLTASEIVDKRQATLAMSKVGLAALIKQNPAIQKEVEAASGYAVFSTQNFNIVLVVVSRGEGVLFDRRRPEPIFMEALKTGEGIGAGYQDQYQIIIFKNTDAIDQFLLTSIDGQRGGMDVDANFSAGSGGTVRSFNPYISIYTVGLSGYDLQANYGGTLYLVDQQINDAKTLSTLPSKKK